MEKPRIEDYREVPKSTYLGTRINYENYCHALLAYINHLESKVKNLDLHIVSGSLPDNYEDKKDSFMDFLETAYMIDVNMQPLNEVADKIERSIDNWTKYVRGNDR